MNIKQAIEKFNRYRSPEARAELLEVCDDTVKVKFSGAFCVSCGIYDYFEDLIWFGLNAEIVTFERIDDGFVVTYRLKS